MPGVSMVPGPRTGPYGEERSLQAVTIVDGNGPTIFSKKIVQHPVDRDKRLHGPSLPSAMWQAAREYVQD